MIISLLVYKKLLICDIDQMSQNLVQELVQEMGANNPALTQGMSMGAPAHAGQGFHPQMGMAPQPQMMQPQGHMMQPQMAHHQLPPQQYSQENEGYMTEEQQMHEMMNLAQFGMDEEHRPVSDRLMDQLRELFFLVVVFFILSLPQVSSFIQRTVPQVADNFYYLVGLKGLILAVVFWVAHYFEII